MRATITGYEKRFSTEEKPQGEQLLRLRALDCIIEVGPYDFPDETCITGEVMDKMVDLFKKNYPDKRVEAFLITAEHNGKMMEKYFPFYYS